VPVLVHRADHRHGATGYVEQGGNDTAVQDAVHEVAHQLILHRQVHDHPLGGYFVQLDPQHEVEGNALEHLAYGLGMLSEQCVIVVHGLRSCWMSDNAARGSPA